MRGDVRLMRDQVEEVAKGVSEIQISQISASFREAKSQKLLFLGQRATLERYSGYSNPL